LQWERGGVGNAEWTGVRLAEVLSTAKLKPEASHVHMLGADGPPSPKTPAFFRSIPLEKALDPNTIIALEMNGEPLPVLHGGPMRLVVPGWAGNHWMKWLRALTIAAEEAPGFYQRSGYRMPKTPAPPEAVLDPATLLTVTTLNVKSIITAPSDGGKHAEGPLELRGVAWTGDGHVTKIEVASDRDPVWRLAELLDSADSYSWRRWRLVVDGLAPGKTVFRARATDSQGEVQPEITPWNRSGYLWNAIDSVTVERL
jgi:DMSO/TMAO reductase YedYZ molybdopterin-dependent catalytic subunit